MTDHHENDLRLLIFDNLEVKNLLNRYPKIKRVKIAKLFTQNLDVENNNDLGFKISAGNSKALVSLCPFHKEKTPSFKLYPSGIFQCYGCGANGHFTFLLIEFLKITSIEELLRILPEYLRTSHRRQTFFELGTCIGKTNRGGD
jgi:hypothetical protein